MNISLDAVNVIFWSSEYDLLISAIGALFVTTCICYVWVKKRENKS